MHCLTLTSTYKSKNHFVCKTPAHKSRARLPSFLNRAEVTHIVQGKTLASKALCAKELLLESIKRWDLILELLEGRCCWYITELLEDLHHIVPELLESLN